MNSGARHGDPKAGNRHSKHTATDIQSLAAVLDKHYKDERIPKPMRIPCKMEYAEETLPNPYTNANEHVTHSWCMFFVDDDWRTMDYLHAVLDCAGLEPSV
jgi:hypothetical protein